jgi:AraC-like DNA-binding protein
MNQHSYTYEPRNTEIKELSCCEILEAHRSASEEKISQSTALFLSTVFHELSTQINSISSFASLLKIDNYQWNEQKKFQYLNSIQTAIKQLNQLIDDVLSMNWTEEEKNTFSLRVLNLSKLLDKQSLLQKFDHADFQEFTKPLFAEIGTFPRQSSSIFPAIPQLNQVFDFIEANYSQQITVHSVAQAVGYSPTYLSNLVKSKTGQTIHTWIVERRMAQARSLLLKTDLSVNRIAEAVGYPDAGHFIRQFRRLHNITPKMWRNKTVNNCVVERV